MRRSVFIGVAWPYADGPLHLGHIAGAYLPADIFARYHRLKGDDVLMVSGSDQHGTPITIKAEQEGISPGQLADTYHRDFMDCFERLGISFDLFTKTTTPNHARVAQEMFLKLMDKGHVYKDTVSQAYCPRCRRYLADRYVEGTCPNCASEGARGDQCEACGKPLTPAELVDARCRICSTTPEFRDSEHFFLRLSGFQEEISAWVKNKSKEAGWRANVKNLTLRYLKEGLKDRAITRDIDWGISLPLEGYEGKRLYVWFEAVIGYLSASKEWAESKGKDWRPFWEDGGTKGYYFIGKDNIPFHTIIWPAILMGYGGLNLPYDVPANEFLTIEGKKLSTSRRWAVWLPDYLENYDPDPLRYLLSITMPESGDADFSWHEFVRRNNDELVATYGNLVNRVLSFVYKNFDGCVPTYKDMGAVKVSSFDDRGNELINMAGAVSNTIFGDNGLLDNCKFKQAIKMAMTIAHEANRYLEETSPWKAIKQDRQAAAGSLYVALRVISCLKTMLYPFLPFSSQKLHEFLGFEGRVEDFGWEPLVPEPGQKLNKPQPLFTKLEDSLIEEEVAKLKRC